MIKEVSWCWAKHGLGGGTGVRPWTTYSISEAQFSHQRGGGGTVKEVWAPLGSLPALRVRHHLKQCSRANKDLLNSDL